MKKAFLIISDNVQVLRRVVVLMALLMPLAACVGTQPNTVDIKPDNSKSAQTNNQNSNQADNPENKKIRADFSAAMLAIKTVEYEKTIRLLTKVTTQSPDNPVPYINLAMVYKIMKNYTLVESNLKQAIQVDPDNPVANHELALLYRKTGRFAEARQVYEKILAKYPNFIMARKNLGILCDLYMNDYACALENYEIYSKFRRDDATVKIWIADLKGKK